MTANTNVNRLSRKELVALGTAIAFTYVSAISAFLTFFYSGLNPIFYVFYWIGGVCWFLALVLSATFGYRLAKRQGWDGMVGALLAVIPWLVITGLAILFVLSLYGTYA